MLGRLLERRGAFQNLWASGALFERGSSSGVAVNDDTALRLSAVYACIRLIADTISTLPVDQYIRRDGQRFPYRPREEWVTNPNSLHPRTTFYSQVMVSLLLDGNAFIHVMRNPDGTIFSLDVLNPHSVKPVMTDDGRMVFEFRDQHRAMVIQRQDMLHLTELLLPGELRGVSRVEKAKESLGLGLALEQYAATFFGNGSYAGGVIEWPGEITPEQARELVGSWEAGHKGLRRAHRPAVLYGGAKFTPTTVNPSESQLLAERQFAVEEVARLFRVPLFALGVTTPGAMSYASVEQQQLHFLTHTIQPYVVLLEDSLSRLLFNPDTFIKFNISSLVRSDLATRTQAYSTALLAGYMSVNDVRALEDMRAVEDGDSYRVPIQNLPLTDAETATLERKAKIVQQLIIAGYTPQSVADIVGLPELVHTGMASVQLQPEEKSDPSGAVEAG